MRAKRTAAVRFESEVMEVRVRLAAAAFFSLVGLVAVLAAF